MVREVEDDDEHDWMTEAALGANPDDQEYKALRTRFAQKQLAKKVDEAVTTLLRKTGDRGASALDNSLGEDGTCQIDQEEPPKEGLDAGGATVAQDTHTENPRAKCSIKWCRQYMPGHPLSGVPEAPRTKQGQLHTEQLANSHTQWIARLEIEGDKEGDAPPETAQGSNSQRFEVESGQSEHQAFQTVLRWLWDKWKYWQEHRADPAPVSFPIHIQAALKPCPICSAARAGGPDQATVDGECSTMKALWGEEPRPVRFPEAPRSIWGMSSQRSPPDRSQQIPGLPPSEPVQLHQSHPRIKQLSNPRRDQRQGSQQV